MFAGLFPGQGSQCVSMGKNLYDHFSYVSVLLEEMEETLGKSFKSVLFEGPEEILKDTLWAQPCLFWVSISALKVLHEEFGFTINHFSFLAGHSLGELTALCAAEVLSYGDTLKIIQVRSQAMKNSSVPGGMMAIVGLSLEELELFFAEENIQNCEIANDNSPQQIVVSGSHSGLHMLAEKLPSQVRKISLNVSGPFHSSAMTDAQESLREVLSIKTFLPPRIPIVTNVSGLPQTDPLMIKEHLLQQIVSRVLWRTTLMFLEKSGVSACLEIGSGKVLSGLSKKTTPTVPVYSCHTLADIQEVFKKQSLSLAV